MLLFLKLLHNLHLSIQALHKLQLIKKIFQTENFKDILTKRAAERKIMISTIYLQENHLKDNAALKKKL